MRLKWSDSKKLLEESLSRTTEKNKMFMAFKFEHKTESKESWARITPPALLVNHEKLPKRLKNLTLPTH